MAHSPELDVAFLDAAFARGGHSTRVGVALDTLVMARRAVFAHSYALPSLAKELGLAQHRWHRAEDDVAALVELFVRLCDALRPATARDLWNVRVGQQGPITVRDDIAGALEAFAKSGGTASITLRPRGRPASTVVGVVERWDPPYARVRPVGQSTTLRVVRGDRVLRVEGPSV